MSRAGPGRPRSEESRRAILEASLHTLVERGYAGFALEAVAARAGVGKATIYKWWPSRADLAVESFFEDTVPELAFPETGSARTDFLEQVLALRTLLASERGQVLVELIFGARTDALLRKAIGTRWVGPRKRWGSERLARARKEGELIVGVDAEVALDLFYGPLYARLLIGMGTPDETYVRSYLELAFDAVFVASSR